MNIQPSEPVNMHRHPAKVWQWPLWGLAFRPFFLGAALSSVASLLLWQGWLSGYLGWQGVWTPALWHAHEMLFGFGATVAVGFVLTAAQTWTGVKSLSGVGLMVMSGFWIAARGLFFGAEDPLLITLALVCQASWWLMAIAVLANMLFKSRNRRNYVFIPVFIVMASMNGLMLMPVIGAVNSALWWGLSQHLAYTTVLLFTLLMSVVGGRVIPFFTLNALKRERGLTNLSVTPSPRLDKALLSLSVLAISFFVSSYWIQFVQPGWLMMLLSVLHLWRLSRWHGLKTWYQPLLWSLHLSYLMMSLGLACMGLALVEPGWLNFKDSLHLVTIGAIGAMILAMMSRVSLGHTGRPLVIRSVMSVALALVFCAALVRVLLPLFHLHSWGWWLSTVFWCVAFALFLFVYLPVLVRSRIDGRPG